MRMSTLFLPPTAILDELRSMFIAHLKLFLPHLPLQKRSVGPGPLSERRTFSPAASLVSHFHLFILYRSHVPFSSPPYGPLGRISLPRSISDRPSAVCPLFPGLLTPSFCVAPRCAGSAFFKCFLGLRRKYLFVSDVFIPFFLIPSQLLSGPYLSPEGPLLG